MINYMVCFSSYSVNSERNAAYMDLHLTITGWTSAHRQPELQTPTLADQTKRKNTHKLTNYLVKNRWLKRNAFNYFFCRLWSTSFWMTIIYICQTNRAILLKKIIKKTTNIYTKMHYKKHVIYMGYFEKNDTRTCRPFFFSVKKTERK